MSLSPPLEISEAIIDYLQSDMLTLYACSLTCRSWVYASRSHIFSKVDLYPRNFQRFLHVLQSPTKPGKYVRRLTLNEGRGCFEAEPPWMSVALPTLAGCLLGVKELCIRKMQWDLLSDTARNAIIAGFKGVERLDLRHVSFPSLAHTLEFIGSFPSSSDLSYDVVVWSRDTPVTKTRPPPLLHTLHLGSCSKEHFVRWILSEELRIHDVRLTAVSAKQTRTIGDLLRGIGPNLDYLKIGLSYISQREADDVLNNDINLAHNVFLRSIHLDDMVIIGSSHNYMLFKWIPRILSQIISSRMVEVRFRLWLNIVDELDAVDWVQIEHILEHSRFSGLRRVVFVVLGQVNRSHAMESIVRRLPALHARGLVHFL